MITCVCFAYICAVARAVQTPLHLAVEAGAADIVKLLLAAGAYCMVWHAVEPHMLIEPHRRTYALVVMADPASRCTLSAQARHEASLLPHYEHVGRYESSSAGRMTA